MAKLIISFEGITVNEYELDKEIVTIGRKSSNDIQVDDFAVSGAHAKVLTILNDSFIEDLSSTNGTLIDGERITKHALANGDTVILGQHQLQYVNEAIEASEGDFEKTMIIQPGTEDKPLSGEESKKLHHSIGKIAAELASAGAAGSEGPGKAFVKILNGGNSGKQLKLTKILTTLGKPGIQVAAVTRRPTGYYLLTVDPGTSKRPTVNEIEVSNQAHPLCNGDTIEVAGVQMGFYID